MKTTTTGDSLYVTEDLADRLDLDSLTGGEKIVEKDSVYSEPENTPSKQHDCSLYVFFEDQPSSPLVIDGILTTFSGGKKGWLVEVDEADVEASLLVAKRMSEANIKTVHVHRKLSSLACLEENLDVTMRFGPRDCNVSVSSDSNTAI